MKNAMGYLQIHSKNHNHANEKKPISDDFRLRGPVIKESFHTKGATSIVVCIGVFPVAHIGPVGEGSTARHIYNIIDRSQRCLVVYS